MAELFVVPKQVPQETGPDDTGDPFEPFAVSGDIAADLESALMAIAFLLEWVDSIGWSGLLDCAEKVRRFRTERHD